VKLRSNLVPTICAGAVVALVTLSGCANEPPAPGSASSAVAKTTGSSAASPGAGRPTLEVTQTRLGPVVVGPDGRTLYRFDRDSAKPSASRCGGACLNAWPPLVGDVRSVTTTGIDSSLLGSIARADGTTQLTLNGWPLYFYAGDGHPGDLNGEGVGGTWHAIAPTGKPAAVTPGGGEPSPTDEPSPTSEPSPTDDGGYGGGGYGG